MRISGYMDKAYRERKNWKADWFETEAKNPKFGEV